MNLSVCLIVKNEEKNIRRCLESFKGYDLELIVVDTGSNDSTKIIAAEYTSSIFDYDWKDNFSDARNFAISKASNDVIFFIDADEYIRSLDLKLLKKEIDANPGCIYRILCCNHFTRDGLKYENHERIGRIFHKKLYHYQGSVHEQLVPIDSEKAKFYNCCVSIDHTGYDLDEISKKRKADRNIALLKNEYDQLLSKDPQSNECCYVLYQLGKSYYTINDYTDAIFYFEKALLYDVNPEIEYISDLIETYGYALLNDGQVEKAYGLSEPEIYKAFAHSSDYLFLIGLIYMKNAMFNEAIREFQNATKKTDAKCVGVNSFLAYHNIAVIYECLGDKSKAEEYYRLSEQSH